MLALRQADPPFRPCLAKRHGRQERHHNPAKAIKQTQALPERASPEDQVDAVSLCGVEIGQIVQPIGECSTFTKFSTDRLPLRWAKELASCAMVAFRPLRGRFAPTVILCHRRQDRRRAGRVKERASMVQSKTGRPVRFEITETTRASVDRWIHDPEMVGNEFLWSSLIHDSPHLSTRQYARIVRGWVTSLDLEPSAYGTHSMPRTKVAQIYKKTGNLCAVQLLLGHRKMDSTLRYLGVDIEDALSLSEGSTCSEAC